jgi:hypothetical protein
LENDLNIDKKDTIITNENLRLILEEYIQGTISREDLMDVLCKNR